MSYSTNIYTFEFSNYLQRWQIIHSLNLLFLSNSCCYQTNMAVQRVGLVSLLLGLILSLVACIQVHLAMFTVRSSVQRKEINSFLVGFLRILLRFRHFKMDVFKWKSTSRANRANFPPLSRTLWRVDIIGPNIGINSFLIGFFAFCFDLDILKRTF